MRTVLQFLRPLTVASVIACAAPAVLAQEQSIEPQTPLTWAYALNPPGMVPFVPEGPQTVPGSDVVFTFPLPRSLYDPPDWHPTDHPPMPDIVARGRNPGVFACGYCHLPNGQGRPENASLAGLPAEYIMQQWRDWQAGLRESSEPQHGPTNNMRAVAANATEAEVQAAAAYFASLAPVKWIRVVETDTVPVTEVSGWMYIDSEGDGVEPIGNRILELPEDLHRTELRDSRSGFIAYVPTGSIARGKALAENASGGAACAACHGVDLKGLGPVPGLAGRSPSYIARQLYDFQNGKRRGQWSPLMSSVVAGLSLEKIVELSAYLASLDP